MFVGFATHLSDFAVEGNCSNKPFSNCAHFCISSSATLSSVAIEKSNQFLFAGTLYEEVCENGLVFDGHGAVHNHCNYNWAVDCGKRVYDDTPISSPGCLYQFGIYPVGEGCQTTFLWVLNFGQVGEIFKNFQKHPLGESF